jgi:hypothetical protein
MDDFSEADPYHGMSWTRKFFKKYLMLPQAIHPQSNLMIGLIFLQTLAFLYNAWSIPLRFTFHIYQHDANWHYWAASDYFFDSIYILDTVVFRTRLMFLDTSGIYETKRKETIINFVKNGTFKKDILSLFPLDLFYLVTGFTGRATLLRLPRLLRYYHFMDLFDRLDAALPYPMLVRLSRTINVMLYLVHMAGCTFYAFSDIQVVLHI